jgi:hypothetical protein
MGNETSCTYAPPAAISKEALVQKVNQGIEDLKNLEEQKQKLQEELTQTKSQLDLCNVKADKPCDPYDVKFRPDAMPVYYRSNDSANRNLWTGDFTSFSLTASKSVPKMQKQVRLFYKPHHGALLPILHVSTAPHHFAKKAEIAYLDRKAQESINPLTALYFKFLAHKERNEPAGFLTNWTEERGGGQLCDCKGLVHASGRVLAKTVQCTRNYDSAKASSPFRVAIIPETGELTGYTHDGYEYNGQHELNPHLR